MSSPATAQAAAWTDKERARHAFRVGLFQRRGLDEAYATQLADRLWERDAERDDRRLCLECAGLQRGGTCFPASQGRMHGVDRRYTPVQDQLQRCPNFTWSMPA